MVFFTCNSCGESLKKNAVEKHSYKCRTSQGLSCMDCSKEFGEDNYAMHKSCVTEDQKYGGSNYVQKEFKGKKKQEQWTKNLNQFLNNTTVDPSLKKLLETVTSCTNIPRKEKKFKNFLLNSVKVKTKLVDKAWDVFKGALVTTAEVNSTETAPNETANGTEAVQCSDNVNGKNQEPTTEKKRKRNTASVEDKDCNQENKPTKKKKHHHKHEQATEENSLEMSTHIKKKKKKSKHHDDDNDDNNNDNNSGSKHSVGDEARTSLQNGHSIPITEDHSPSEFKWKISIKKVLKDAPEGKMKLKRLEKLVVKQYLASGRLEKEDRNTDAKELFKKKINNEKFIVEGKYIKIK